jgi:AraC-like DNA-binding protein
MTWIQLLTEEPDLLVVVQRLAPHGTPVRIVRRRSTRYAVPAAAVVVATSGSRTRFVLQALEEVETLGLKSRTVVLAPFSRELATALVRRTCPPVVWLDDVGRELGAILRRMVDSDLRFVITEALLVGCGADLLLQRAVREAFAGTDCPTTVSRLAARAHCTPSTLRAHWRRSGLPDSPQALVEWAVLAALAELRGDGSKISAVSRLIGLHETTLYRAARRRVGVSPSLVDRTALLAAIGDWLPSQAG